MNVKSHRWKFFSVGSPIDTYQPIENHGIIGDLSTAALVGMEGSIDFMCFPAFDSPTVFAALLDQKRGGYFKIAPFFGQFKQRQFYLPDTNILITRFLGRPEYLKFLISWRYIIWGIRTVSFARSKWFEEK